MKRAFLAGAIVLIAVAACGSIASAQTYEASSGFYGTLGLAVGWNNLNGPRRPADNGTMMGFTFGGGYRLNSWAAAEIEFLWVGGGELFDWSTGRTLNASLASLGVAGKLYPLALAPDLIPQWIQPNLSFGIGTGFAEQALLKPLNFGSTSQTVLLTRIGVGLDIMFTKHWGTYLDGSYYVTNNDVLTGIGTLKLGVLCHF